MAKKHKHVRARSDLFSFKGIIGVGGDGTQNKIITALMERDLSHIPVGVIPAGSGDALAGSIFHASKKEGEEYGVEAMVERIVEGKISPLSLWHYRTNRNESGLSFLGLSFGVISDININSEWMRPIFGSKRFEVSGFFEWLGLKSYLAVLSYNSKDGERVILKTSFRQIWAVSTSRGSAKIAVPPKARLDDDFLHILYVEKKEISRCDLFKF